MKIIIRLLLILLLLNHLNIFITRLCSTKQIIVVFFLNTFCFVKINIQMSKFIFIFNFTFFGVIFIFYVINFLLLLYEQLFLIDFLLKFLRRQYFSSLNLIILLQLILFLFFQLTALVCHCWIR